MILEQLSTLLHKTGSTGTTKTANIYLKLCFWTQNKYNEWTNTVEAHANTRYKFTFIEDKQGNGVSDTTLKAIQKTM